MLIGTWYGMNFVHIPELAWRYSYAAVTFISIALTAGAYFYFRKRKWF